MNEPKVIYLNIGFDKDDFDLKNEDFESLIGISWSDTRINEQDIKYELSERQQSNESNVQHDSEALSIADVKHRFSSNDVDGAYLLGVFNVSGIDGLADEIKRLKELKVNPHNIINSIKSNGA